MSEIDPPDRRCAACRLGAALRGTFAALRRMRWRRVLAASAWSWVPFVVHAREPAYTVIDIDPQRDRLELFLDDDAQRPFLRLARLDAWLRERGRRLRWAMNAGMFRPGFAPVGLFVADGVERSPLDLGDAYGNFYLKPNGVFLVDDTGARIVESSEYARLAQVRLATQSGPLLLRNGALHPRLDPASRSLHIRNGVGLCGARVRFVISDTPVTLHAFALHFRDALGCADALYFDGSVSSLYWPERGRDDARATLGPMIGVVDTP
jgi:uncharacterized protein YigE (DUF2233 family)